MNIMRGNNIFCFDLSRENVLIFQTLFVAKPRRRPRQDTATAADLITPRCGMDICDPPTDIFICSKGKAGYMATSASLLSSRGWALL